MGTTPGNARDAHATRSLLIRQVRTLLAAKNMSQQDLGNQLGIHPTTICRKMASPGRRWNDWSAPEIHAMAVLFKVPVGFFFGEDVEIEWLNEMQQARERRQQRQ